jgi:hypothetical protein
MIRHSIKGTLALLGVLAASTTAGAATTIIPAASGHPFYISEATQFNVFDNYVEAGQGIHHWATPLTLTNKPSGSITVYQYGSLNTCVKSAAFAFDSQGNAVAWNGAWTKESLIGTITIPSNGTAFVRTELMGNVDPATAPGCQRNFFGRISQFRVVH